MEEDVGGEDTEGGRQEEQTVGLRSGQRSKVAHHITARRNKTLIPQHYNGLTLTHWMNKNIMCDAFMFHFIISQACVCNNSNWLISRVVLIRGGGKVYSTQ